MDQLTPIVTMVAEARAAYIKAAFDLPAECGGAPSVEQNDGLRVQRLAFTELVDAVNALGTAIARGYLYVEDARAC